MKKYLLLIVIAALVFVVIVSLILYIGSQRSREPKKDGVPFSNPEKDGPSFSNPEKTPHYESNTPDHASVLAAVPINVVINFDFDLAPESTISIKQNGKEYGISETVVADNKLSMRRQMDTKAPDGIYTVEYTAYWPDKSYHDGSFQFAIDKKKKSSFKDLTDKKIVTIKIVNLSFEPRNVKISKGAKVTWINEDGVEHFVNTDSHPAHTYYPKQNSRALKKGQKFSLIFDKTGIYPYHCSAHASEMRASIIVK